MSMRPNVLSIGYDLELLEDRHLLMREAGINVMSVPSEEGFQHLPLWLRVDAIVMGSEIPLPEQNRFVQWVRVNAPGVQVISLRREGQPREETCVASEERPDHWIGTLCAALKRRSACPEEDAKGAVPEPPCLSDLIAQLRQLLRKPD